jgi:tRNA threonylcarbamoyladenosine biosynthesis protein TsaB
VIVAFSTSSPLASVALISPKGEIIWQGEEDAPKRASGACISMLQQLARTFNLKHASLFVADVGPGSFTGVRVGVILAKSFGFAFNRPVAGATAFDLIATERPVALPSKKGEYFVRIVGEPPHRVDHLVDECIGYGPAFPDPTFPHAKGFSNLVSMLEPMAAELFVPEYLVQPSISQPKKPFKTSASS